MDAAVESGRNPVSKHQPIRFSLSVKNERADGERDGRTRLAAPNSQARTGIEEGRIHVSFSADHEQDWQPHSVDAQSDTYIQPDSA